MSVEDLKSKAIAEAVAGNEMVAFVKYLSDVDGYTYAEFLEDCRSPDAPSRTWSQPDVVSVVTTQPEPVVIVDETDSDDE